MIGLLRPYRRRVILMFTALLLETGAALAPPYLARQGDRQRDRRWRRLRARLDRRRLRLRHRPLRRRHLLGDLPRRLGRDAGAAGPARADLHPPAVDVDRLLHPPQPRRPDLADDQRRRSAEPARHQRRGDDLLQHPDPGRGRRDHALPRRQAGADHLRHLPPAGGGERRLPDRLRRHLPRHPRAHRRGHRLPAGDAQRRAGGAQLRPGAAPRGGDDRPERSRTATST